MSDLHTNMVSLAVDFIMPGTVLGSDVFDSRGNKVLDAKVPFTPEIIQQLKKTHIDRIYYSQEEKGANAFKSVAERSEQEKLLLTVRKLSVQVSAELERSIQNEEFIQTTGVHQLVDILMKYNEKFPGIPQFLLVDKTRENDFSDHALNTCILSIVIAKKHSFENALTKQIAIGAYLHDLGKFRIDPALINKNGSYTPEEVEEIKKHAVAGFELIKLNGQLSSIVRKIILLHHEATDGTGYPLGIKEKDVGYYPYIVSLANIFDNLTTSRPHRAAMPLKDSLNMLIQIAGKKLPGFLVQLFIRLISTNQQVKSSYTVGDFVILNTEEVAQITGINNADPDAPMVRVIKDQKGRNQDPPLPVDLSKNRKRTIEKVLRPELQRQLLLRYPLSQINR